MMEVKKKLKKGLPVLLPSKPPTRPLKIRIDRPRPPPPPPDDDDGEDDDEMANALGADDDVDDEGGDSDDDVANAFAADDGDGGDDASADEIEVGADEGTEDEGDDASVKEGGAKGGAEGEVDPYEGLSPEEREAKEKQEYMWRFHILRKKGAKNVPAYNEHDDLVTMKNTYARTIREIHLDSSVESYKKYLIGGFFVVELTAANMGFDMSGFAMEQLMTMDQYESVLVELGERPYSSWGSTWPPEVKLLAMIMGNAMLFGMIKMISQTYPGAGEIVRTLTGKPPAAAINAAAATSAAGISSYASGSDQRPKVGPRTMRGPSVKISPVEDEEEVE
jgi:hypothetical protein